MPKLAGSTVTVKPEAALPADACKSTRCRNFATLHREVSDIRDQLEVRPCQGLFGAETFSAFRSMCSSKLDRDGQRDLCENPCYDGTKAAPLVELESLPKVWVRAPVITATNAEHEDARGPSA